MGKKKVYYIDNDLEIKQGYTGANIDFKKANEIMIDYKNNKIKVSSELVSGTKNKLYEQLNKMKVIKLAEEYELKARWVNTHLEINSQLDEWYVYENECHKLVWVHRNKRGSKYDNHEHVQKVMYSNKEDDFRYIFKSISEHDSYELHRYTHNHMMHLFDMIKTNNVPKIKIS